MRAAGVPLVPGTEGAASLEEIEAAARAIGFPVLLKATAGGGGKGMRLVDEPEALEDALRRGLVGGGGGVRRRLALPREGRRSRAPRRDPGALRRARRRAHARRARVLDPAAPPEARRGVAVGGPLRRDARGDGGVRRACLHGGRLPRRRDVRVPARAGGRAVLHRGELPAPGRAPGLGARHRHRHRARAAPDRGRGAAHARPGARRGAGTRSRCGSTPRIRAAASCRHRARSRGSGRRSGPASGSTRRSRTAPRSRRTTTR